MEIEFGAGSAVAPTYSDEPVKIVGPFSASGFPDTRLALKRVPRD